MSEKLFGIALLILFAATAPIQAQERDTAQRQQTRAALPHETPSKRPGLNDPVKRESPAMHSRQPEALIKQGEQLLQAGQPKPALNHIQQALSSGGDKILDKAYLLAGWCWFYLGDYETQLAYISHFRENNPRHLMGIYGQVYAYLGLEDYKMATAMARQIKKDYHDHPQMAHLEALVGEMLLFEGKTSEALTHLERATELKPNTANRLASRSAMIYLGYTYLHNEQEEKGKKLIYLSMTRRFREWQESPEKWELSFEIASAYAALGKKEKAYQWLTLSVMAGYPGHLWTRDPIFAPYHGEEDFSQLVNEARERVK